MSSADITPLNSGTETDHCRICFIFVKDERITDLAGVKLTAVPHTEQSAFSPRCTESLLVYILGGFFLLRFWGAALCVLPVLQLCVLSEQSLGSAYLLLVCCHTVPEVTGTVQSWSVITEGL